MTSGRKLRKRDIGKVFVRVDSEGKRGKFLFLKSLGDHSPAVASFVTFCVIGGKARAICDMGYFNGQWFQEVRGFSAEFLADILRRYEQYWNDRLRQINEAAEAENERNALLQARFGKPATWLSLGDGLTSGKIGREYVVWFDPDRSKYSVEVYGETAQLLTFQNLKCSHGPRFGMDPLDYDKIFGVNGLLSQLVEQVENESKIPGPLQINSIRKRRTSAP